MFCKVCVFVAMSLVPCLPAFAADQHGEAPIPTQIRAGKRVLEFKMGGEWQNFNSPAQAAIHRQFSV